MNNGIEMGDVTFFVDGKAIGTIDPIKMKVDVAQDVSIEDGKNIRFANKSYSGTLTGAKISEEFKGLFGYASQKYTVVAESYNFPRGNKLPKKKRIRDKWMKKYHKKIELENVYIN